MIRKLGLARRLAVLVVMTLIGCVSPQVKLGSEDIAQHARPVDKDKTIALIGGTGMAGRYILQRVLAEGYPVKVLARSPAKLETLASRIEIVQGDARDPEAIARLVSGSDVVITLDADNSVTLQDTLLADLRQDDFTFV